MKTQFDRYSIEMRLGQGAMSTVYKALDTKLNRKVALKILHPHLLQEGNWVARFEEEAKTLAKISHPNVTQVYDFGMRDDQYFIALELIEGMDFSELLKKHSAIPWEIASILFLQIANGLHHVHNNGIIHRDIKLANLLLQSNGNAKISDFSISKSEEAISLTAIDQLPGTPSYIAPELISGENPSVSSDVFAFGVAFYQTLTGVPPFFGTTVAALFDKIRAGGYPSLEAKGVFAHKKIGEIIRLCLDVNPDKRFASMADVAENISAILADSAIHNDPALVQGYLKNPDTSINKIRSHSLKEALTEAKRLRDEGKIFESIHEFKKVLSLDPSNSEAEEALRTFPAQQGSTDITIIVPAKKRKKGLAYGLIAIIIATTTLLIIFLPSDPVPPTYTQPAKTPTIKIDKDTVIAVLPEQPKKQQKKKIEAISKQTEVITPVIEPVKIDTPEAPVVITPPNEPCSGSLSIFSQVWAYIYIDGVKKGTAPAKTPFELPCGKHSIELKRPSGDKYSVETDITSGNKTHLSIQEKDYTK